MNLGLQIKISSGLSNYFHGKSFTCIAAIRIWFSSDSTSEFILINLKSDSVRMNEKAVFICIFCVSVSDKMALPLVDSFASYSEDLQRASV